MKKALKYLSKDKVLKGLIKEFPKPVLKKSTNYFSALVRSIIYQQLSGKSASSIEKKFLALFKKGLNEKDLLKLKETDFKKAGISPQKQKYLRDLATRFIDGTVNPKNFHKMTDGEILEHLVVVKGVGVWTGQMFLMFTLNRMDILPTGDLGIMKGFQFAFNLKKLPDSKKMEKLAKEWSPYKTVASLYLWKVADKNKEK